MRNALNSVDADAMSGCDHPDARAILPAQSGLDGGLKVRGDFGPSEPLALIPGRPEAGTDLSWLIDRSRAKGRSGCSARD